MKILIAVAADKTGRPDVSDALRCALAVAETLAQNGYAVSMLQVDEALAEDRDALCSALRSEQPDCVFNLFEGFADNPAGEADFAELLEGLALPFTGNRAATLRLCLDKQKTKQLLSEHHIPVPAGICLRPGDTIPEALPDFPLFVKPCCEDASVGIDDHSLVMNRDALSCIVPEKLAQFPDGIIVETFLSGIEYNVGCIGISPYEVLGVSVMDYGMFPELPQFMTYGAKWEPATEEFHRLLPDPVAEIMPAVRQQLERLAVKAGQALSCCGYFRIDFREHRGTLWVIDVNPNPDINRESGLVRQASARGMTYAQVLDKIIKTAIHEERLL